MASVEMTQDRFDSDVPKEGLAVIDFWAPWCRPCSQFSPVFNAVSDKFQDVGFFNVNTDMSQELARKFGIQSLPTVVILINGSVAFRRAGVMTARELERTVSRFAELLKR